MTTEIYNPNPTIFAPVKTRRREPSLKIKYEAYPADDSDVEDELNEMDPIDQDEIFGATYFKLGRSFIDIMPS
jgi:hypothetical protein